MLKTFPKSLLIALVLLLVVVLTPVALAAPPEQAEQTIVDIAANDGRFTTLVAALQAAGLDRTLSGPGPFTVFAPTDDAFAALPAGTVEALLADIPALSDVLLYHVVAGKLLAADVAAQEQANTLLGEAAPITAGANGPMIGGAVIVITDIEGSNGVIHVIDAVLLPPSMQTDASAAPAEVITPTTAIAPLAAVTTTATITTTADASPVPAEGQGGGFYYPRNPYYGYYYPHYNSCYYNCYRPYYHYQPNYPNYYYYPTW